MKKMKKMKKMEKMEKIDKMNTSWPVSGSTMSDSMLGASIFSSIEMLASMKTIGTIYIKK